MLSSLSGETLEVFKQVLLVLTGAISAILGGFLATWYQTKKARKIRREEVIGERQVEVYQQAARVASSLQSVLMQGTLEDAVRYVNEQGDWFWKNRLFLPQGFQNKWISLKSNLRRAVHMEKAQATQKDENERGKQIDTLGELESFLDQLAEEAEKEILGELGLSPIEIEKFSRKKQEASKS